MDFVGRNSLEGRKEGGLRFRGRYRVRRLVRFLWFASFSTVDIAALMVVGPGSGFTHLVSAGRYLGRSWAHLQTLDAFGADALFCVIVQAERANMAMPFPVLL